MFKHLLSAPSRPGRVLILGGKGFISTELRCLLAEAGIATVSVGSQEVNLLAADAQARLAAFIQPDDAVVMTSALTPDKGRDVATFMKNLTMVQHVTQALAEAKCAHFVYLSSDAVFSDNHSLVNEQTPMTGAGLYGLMHVARELMLQTALAPLKIPLCILRPCAVYGAADTHNSYGPNRFLRLALRKEKITLFGNGEEERDHLYVRDLVRVIKLSLEHRTEGALNVASGTAVSFHEIVRLAMQFASMEGHLECLPRSSPITHKHFDNALLQRAFPGFEFTPLETGLKEASQELSGTD